MLRRTHLLFVALCASVIFSAPCAFAKPSVKRLISNDLLSNAGLKSAWQLNLSLKDNEKLGPMYIDGKYLYTITDKNYLFCLDRNKGVEIFSTQLAVPGLPVKKPVFYDGKAYFTIGKTMIVLDPELGRATASAKLKVAGSSTSCPVVRNSYALYVAGSNKRLYVLDSDEYFLHFMATADNDSMINSIVATDAYVIFATESGNIAKILGMSSESQWQTDIAEGLSAAIVKDNEDLYVSSLDMRLYKISVDTGDLVWSEPFQTGQALTSSVRLGKDMIYQYAINEGVYAIDKVTGKKVWNLPCGYDLLCEQGTRTYLLGFPSMLCVMDNIKNKLLYSINAAGVTSYAVNTDDSLIYLSSKDGRVQSIKIENPKFIIE